MFKTALHENGLFRLPKHIVERLSLQAGDTLCCHMEDRILYVTPEKEFNPTFSPPIGAYADIPSEFLLYQVQWRDPGHSWTLRYNPLEFYCAYLQMTVAMRYILNDAPNTSCVSKTVMRLTIPAAHSRTVFILTN